MRLIDADAISWTDLNDDPNSKIRVLVTFADKVNKMPTIEPERKKGEWVPAKDGYEGHVKCTGCFKTYDWTSQAQYYDYCPKCGCRMTEEPEDIPMEYFESGGR